jgi:hypothetical protein
MGRRALSLGIKQPGSEADYSPPTSSKVKKKVDPYIHSSTNDHGAILT